jgi:phage shock protein A
MGVLERLSTLIRANINDMLDHAEDPEIMLNQILRDMEVEIARARGQVTEMMAQERLFRDDLTTEQKKSTDLQGRAEYYVRQGNDMMAREALKRKGDSDANMAVLQQQLSAQSEMVTRLREQLDALQEKYQNALNNRENLLARHRRAAAQQQITRTMSNLDVTDYTGDLARMEQRIRMEEARAGAAAELTNEDNGDSAGSMFDTAERNMEIDNQLAALKAKLGPTPPSGETHNLGTKQS